MIHVQDQIFGENETRILVKEIAQSDEHLNENIRVTRGKVALHVAVMQ
jgi:hypothetical protein